MSPSLAPSEANCVLFPHESVNNNRRIMYILPILLLLCVGLMAAQNKSTNSTAELRNETGIEFTGSGKELGVLKRSFPDDVIGLLKALMSIESNSGNEGDLVDYLVEGLITDGWFVHRQNISEKGDRANIYATRKLLSEHVPRLVLNSHVDTVPPHVAFSQDSENIYGRGSCDAKGQIACMILAARRLVNEHHDISKDVALLFTVGEEVDYIGMKTANSLPSFAPEFLVVGEPTEMKFATIQKGVADVVIRTKGKAGHSGYPETGHSAVHTLVQILNNLMTHDWPKDERLGDTTYNIGQINGGQAINAWAEKAEASVCIRITTSYADVKGRLEEIVGGRAELDLSLGGNDPVHLSVPSFPHQTYQASYGTDIPYYAKYKELKGVYLFGAGSITVAHGPGEFVPIKELHECVDKHVQLAVELLSKK